MNTRLRPTPYADAHIGHAWAAFKNWELARRSGGQFVLIFDDYMYRLQRLHTQSWSVQVAISRYIEDLAWLGMRPDVWFRSSENDAVHGRAAEKLGFTPPANTRWSSWFGNTVSNADGSAWVTYHDWLVMVRVIDDHLSQVGGFYRGEDLITETQLYDHICRRLGWVPPGQTYLPVVRRATSAAKESKSNSGGISIRELRAAGYSPDGIIDTLVECDFRSRAAGFRDLVIPEGFLELDQVATLTWADRISAGYVDAARGKPWERDVEEALA